MKRTDKPPQRYPLALPGLGGGDSGPVPLAPSISACPGPVWPTEAGRVLRVFLAQLSNPNQLGKAPHSRSPEPLRSLLSVGMEQPPGYPMSSPTNNILQLLVSPRCLHALSCLHLDFSVWKILLVCPLGKVLQKQYQLLFYLSMPQFSHL